MARNCSGSEARGHRFHLGKQLRVSLRRSLFMPIQGYGEVTIPKYPYLKPLISGYHAGPDQLGMVAISSDSPSSLYSPGPYWEQPGRSIVEGILRDVPIATDVCPGAFSEFRRSFFSCTSLTTPYCNLSNLLFRKYRI